MKGTFSRFIAIAAIVALGVGLLSGLMAMPIDMRTTIDEYFDRQNMHDLRIVSPLGLTDDDVAAIAAVDGVVPDKCVRAVAARFQGVEHRIELVRELDGVKYYNDSIGTSPSRTVACLESFPEPVILIAGGYDKGIPFHALALEIRERVKTLVLTGDTARAIRQAVEEAEGGRGCPEIIQTEDLAGAVEAARRAAGPGDVVVLSPACAAFDRFKNFMERGRAFKELVRSL